MTLDSLVGKQNADGGWPHVRGKSSTEPTVYAVLAMFAAGQRDRAARGLGWLRATQRADGGWAPQPGVEESNWTTALAALLPPDALGPAAHDGAVEWLARTVGRESTFPFRLRTWLLGNSLNTGFAGWPWIPGAGAWVGPTSLAILALAKANRRRPLAEVGRRIDAGRNFLLARACAEGGWNYGSARAMGDDLTPYADTTGMGLAALRGVAGSVVDRSLAVARKLLAECRSAGAHNWLRLGLAAHGELRADDCRGNRFCCRTTSETALDLLLSDAAGRDLFWES